MKGIPRWLGTRPHRGTVINLMMLAMVLAMVRSPALYLAVGGGTLLLATVFFLSCAVRRSLRMPAERNTYQLAMIWLPGLLAGLLALVALDLVTSYAPSDLAYGLGAILFAVELAMIALGSADLLERPAAPAEAA